MTSPQKGELVEIIRLRNHGLLDHDYQKYCGITMIEQRPTYAKARLVVTDKVSNLGGNLHGGVIYSILDVTALLSVIPSLAEDEYAVTHNINVSVLSAAKLNTEVFLEANMIRKGRSLVFVEAEAYSTVGDEKKIIARASVTKSILRSESFKDLGRDVVERSLAPENERT